MILLKDWGIELTTLTYAKVADHVLRQDAVVSTTQLIGAEDM